MPPLRSDGGWQLQTMLTPPPILASPPDLPPPPPVVPVAPPIVPPMPPIAPLPIAPSIAPLVTPSSPALQLEGDWQTVVTRRETPAAPQLEWMSRDDWHKVVTRRELKAEDKVERPKPLTVAARRAWTMPAEWTSSNIYGVCIKRLHTDERAAAAGFDDEWSEKAVRRAERAQEDPERAALEKEAEARRKRARRIVQDKEDRDALRELASSRNCDALPLEATPACLRNTATDGTPRSAKAAGATLRQLTQSFYERLLDPRFYGVTQQEVEAVQVSTEFWDRSVKHRQHWEIGVRSLMRYGGKLIETHTVSSY